MDMRQLIRPAALILACGLSFSSSFAQNSDKTEKKKEKEETIVIRKTGRGGNTVVTIRNGSVYVNDEKIVDVEKDEKGVVRKVIISGDGPHFSFSDGDVPMPRKAMLGIMIEPDREKKGALVRDVNPGSAAEKAGLKKGDLITALNGQSVQNAKELSDEIAENHKPGDKVKISYLRDGKTYSTDANLLAANQPTVRQFRFHPDMDGVDMPNLMRSIPLFADDAFEPAPKIGLSVEDRADGEGVRVLNVHPGSAAAAAGFKEGDVISSLNQQDIASVDEFQMMMRNHKGGEKLKLGYQRSGKSNTAEVTLPKSLKKKDL